MATKMGFYELLAPHFLAGFSFDELEFLSYLGIDGLNAAYDDAAVVYTGICSLGGEGGALPKLQFSHAGGSVLSSDDYVFRFRLTIPRNPVSDDVSNALNNLSIGADAVANGFPPPVPTPNWLPPDARAFLNLEILLDQLQDATIAPNSVVIGNPPGSITDAVHMAFQLELIVPTLSFRLGDWFKPGKIEQRRILFDKDYPDDFVKIVMPNVVIQYTQGVDFSAAPAINLVGWGQTGFDGQQDLGTGELIRMVPDIAVHKSGRFGFQLSPIVLDLSQNSTPPEVMNYYGVDNDWTGFFIKKAGLYFGDPSKDWGFSIGISDALLGFNGDVSLEAFAALMAPDDFQVRLLLFDGNKPIDYDEGEQGWTQQNASEHAGKALVPDDAFIQVEITGGVPDYTVAELTYAGISAGWNDVTRTGQIPQTNQRSGALKLHIQDSNGKHVYRQVDLALYKRQAQTIEGPTVPGNITWNHTGTPEHYLEWLANKRVGYKETLRVVSGSGNLNPSTGNMKLTVTNLTDGSSSVKTLTSSEFQVEVQPGKDIQVRVDFDPMAAKHEHFHMFFAFDRPTPEQLANPEEYLDNFENNPYTEDAQFTGSNPPKTAGTLSPGTSAGTGKPVKGVYAFEAWLKHRVKAVNGVKTVTVDGYASFESEAAAQHNQALSKRRADMAQKLIDQYMARTGELVQIQGSPTGYGATKAQMGQLIHGTDPNDIDAPTRYPSDPSTPRRFDKEDRVAVIRGDVEVQNASFLEGAFHREADSQQVIVLPNPPAPFPQSNKPPRVFKALALRMRLERSVPVLFEIAGKIDLETELEEKARAGANQNQVQAPQGRFLQNQQNPADGIVDFVLTITHDTSTNYVTETLKITSDVHDKDGLLWFNNTNNLIIVNAIGAMAAFSPILIEGAGVSATQSGGDWAKLAVAWGIPMAIGAAGIIKTKKLTLYGFEMKFRQHMPPNVNNDQLTDGGIVFDYGVEFQFDMTGYGVPVKSSDDHPLRVRYNSVGFNIHNDVVNNTVVYQPIFDPTKGYEIDLSDPGLFDMPGVLGDLLKVLGARLARFNPLTLELDLALNVDLGIISISELKIKWPIHPLGVPMILPAGVKVDLPSTIKGDGFLHIVDKVDEQEQPVKGFMGGVDLTLIPIKLRIAANLAVLRKTDVTAVFASLTVDFPAPIALGASGLGLYGLSGLFAMHFKRVEAEPKPEEPIGPALKWLIDAGGEPTRLQHKDNTLWDVEKDRWSFGAGILLGTLDGGFLDNMRGMFMLELPGPRILIFINMKLIAQLPAKNDTTDLTVGILGVLDLDFHQKKITVGVLINFNVEDLISLYLPIELYFNYDDSSDWHLYLGTYNSPASADIIGIVRGSGYFMMGGKPINSLPKPLKGAYVAGGVYAPIIFGSKSSGLYLEVSLKADVGVAFAPFWIAGALTIKGELNLWIVSISAHANMLLKAPPGYFIGEICGSVDLFFFEAEGCVDVEIGNDPTPQLEAPELIGKVYLQSYAPVIVSGQGGERPIDASLGDASTTDSDPKMPIVPVDTIPVIQMNFAPKVEAASPNPGTFTEEIKTCPGLDNPDGKVVLGPDTFSATLTGVKLYKKTNGSYTEVTFDSANKPPVVWRKEKDASNSAPGKVVELALNSRCPESSPYAIERSSELIKTVESTWEKMCTPPAPPASVLFTFCDQPPGYSKKGKGWHLEGSMLPDPPGTTRESEPETDMYVGEPYITDDEHVVLDIAQETGDIYPVRSKVVGQAAKSLKELERLRCRRALQIPRLLKHSTPGPVTIAKNADYYNLLESLKSKLWVKLNIGLSAEVTLYILAERNWRENQYYLDQLDQWGQVLSSIPLPAYSPTVVASMSDFPSTWTAPNLPWVNAITEIRQFLTSGKPDFQFMDHLLIRLKPLEKCTTLRLRALPTAPVNKDFSLLVGAVEALSLAEKGRYEFESDKSESTQETINDYLDNGDPGPILEYDTVYKLVVHYNAEKKSKIDPGNGQDEVTISDTWLDLTKEFYFKTDKYVPHRLDSWVMSTAPYHSEATHFWGEPVVIVFNHEGVGKLFETYNAKLQYRFRTANGEKVKVTELALNGDVIINVDLDGGPNDIEPLLDKMPQVYDSPYYDTLSDLTGLLECVSSSGHTLQTDVTIINSELKPLMGYTFDLEPTQLDNQKPFHGRHADPGIKGEVPFFRRRFNTSRYQNVSAFAEDIRSQYILFRTLTADLNLTQAQVPGVTISDALMNAGEESLPAASRNRVVLYYRNSQPYVVLLDTVEPLWRVRQKAELKPVQDPGDSYTYDQNFKQIVWSEETDLEITADTGFITKFVRDFGGTRTLAFINPAKLPNPSGPAVSFKLYLHRPESQFYGRPDEKVEAYTIILAPNAPWEEETFDE